MRAPSERKPALGFIFITLVLLVLGFGIIVPVLPKLVTQFEGENVAAGSAEFGSLVGIFAAMQFIASPILGSLSDRFGRRKVILIALAGTATDYVLMGWAPTLGWLFVARFISGVTAGTLAACNAYIADVTPPERRAQGFGLVGAAFGVGFVVGPLLGGFLGEFRGHPTLRLPFYVAACCVAANWLYGAFVLPESLPPEKRRPFSWKRANPVGSLLFLRRHKGVLDLAGTYFIFNFGQVMLQSIWVLYTGYRYGWNTRQVGLSLALVGIMAIIVQLRLVRPILARTGEKRGLILGLLISSLIMACYGLAGRGWMIYALIPLGALGGIAGPAGQALLTKHVPADEQGALQGSLAGLVSLSSIFAPLLSTWSFGAFIAPTSRFKLPGIAFFESSILIMVALLLALASFRADAAAGRASAGEDEGAGS